MGIFSVTVHRSRVEKLAITKHVQQGVCHTCGLAIYIKKYIEAKEELWKLKCKNINLQKILYYNPTMTNLKFQHKQKYHL